MDPLCLKEGCYMFAPATTERTSCEGACRLARSPRGDMVRVVMLATFALAGVALRSQTTEKKGI